MRIPRFIIWMFLGAFLSWLIQQFYKSYKFWKEFDRQTQQFVERFSRDLETSRKS